MIQRNKPYFNSIYVSFLNENKITDQFIKFIENSGLTVSCKRNMKYREKLGDFLNSIDKSVVILFMLTNDYLKTQ